MNEQSRTQHIPIKMYRSEQRLTIAAPMPGLEPEDVHIEVNDNGRLVLHAALRGALKGDKEILSEEWDAGPYHREIDLPNAVNTELANVTYRNGVVVVVLPLAERTRPARLTLETVGPAHGERVGSAGRTIEPRTTEQHQQERAKTAPEHGGFAQRSG